MELFVKPVSKLLGADEIMMKECIIYGQVLLIFLVPFLLQNAFQSFLIVEEKPTFGLVISIISGISNIFLDFLLIYLFKLGIAGAALATRN